MGTPHHALHRTVLAVDVSAFGRRNSNRQGEIRRGLYEALEGAFTEYGLDWSATYHEDRGDGVLVLVPPTAAKRRVVGTLRHALEGQLRRYNEPHAEDARIRLRVAVTAGEVRHDEHGVVGDEVNLAFRLLDSAPLRDALDRGPGVLALIVSRRFYEDVIRDDPAADPDAYERVPVRVKEVREHAWLYAPDGAPPPRPEPKPPRPHRERRWAPVLLVALLLLVALTGASSVAPAPPPCPDPVQLNVATSTEKVELLGDLAVKFEEASRDFTAHGCKGVSALVFAGLPDERIAAALGQGWPPSAVRDVGTEPHVWLPDSTLEVEAVRRELEAGRIGDVRLVDRSGIAESPVVLGVSAELAERIGRDREFDWADVDRLAEVDASSGTGLAAVIALLHGHPDEPRLDVPLEVREVALLTGAGEPACRGDVAVLASERVVAGDETCRILYPAAGTVVLDHPFVEVQRSGPAHHRREEVVRRFRDYLLSTGVQGELRRAGYRDAQGRTGQLGDPRPSRPGELAARPDAKAVRDAWRAAVLPKRIGLAVDGPDAAVFEAELRKRFGPRDRVERLPATGAVVEEAVRLEVDVLVLLGGRPAPAGPASRVPTVGVGFGAGACDRGTPLAVVVEANGGVCHPVHGEEGSQRALEGVAKAMWGD